MNEDKRELKEEWKEHYLFLEALRRTGVCSMLGASTYLEEAFPLSPQESAEILLNWMHNYDELSKRYEWRE